MAWKSPEHPKIHEALFSDKIARDSVIGPVRIGDNNNILMKVKATLISSLGLRGYCIEEVKSTICTIMGGASRPNNCMTNRPETQVTAMSLHLVSIS